MSYNETLQYLYNLTKYGIKLGLKNTTELLKLLGNPERTFRAVHIAGTNGKGSTARMIAAVLEEMGFRTGLFTSPHLVSFTERITINGREIEESEVVRLTGEIRERIGDTFKPTFFEFITAMAFRYFWENSVEWAVVETGMGGRFDATNVLMPEATVITDISMDHSEFLGDSLEKIAFEKAGIIKEGVPVVTSSQTEEALSVIQKRAEKLKSPLYIYERDFFSEYQKSENSLSFDFHSFQPFRFTLKGVELSTEAPHQIRNASLAIETVLTIFNPDRAEIKNPIIRALKRTTFPGRCEIR
ncbi:MAG: bifunctional folylpolyglutamate synthase/dihydrofolate synthase, partial [Nitrospirae bacterium]